IPLPSTTFGIFSVAFHSAHFTPDWLSQTHPCFHSRGVGSVRRTSHPSGSRPLDVSLLRQTSAPGIVDAPENPRFPAVSNRVQRTDSMAPSRVQLLQGSRQRRRLTRPFGGRPSVIADFRGAKSTHIPHSKPQRFQGKRMLFVRGFSA